MQNSTRPNRPELDATKVPTNIDIAWAAGIYEGEGCCRMCGGTKRGFMASVAQKDPELLYRLQAWFGGSIVGSGNKSQCHNWNICGDRARVFIASIYGFMTTRRKLQIDNTSALEFLGSLSPIGLSVVQIRSELEGFYAKHAREVRERVRVRQAAAYQKRKAESQVLEIRKTA